jgi:hypothetical protein
MFKVLGADGKEYGPVSADGLRQWIAERRANPQTKVQPAGSSEWKSLGELPEFADAFTSAASKPPPLIIPSPPPQPPKQFSGLAIAAFAAALLAPCTAGLAALAGLPLGIVALVKVGRSQGALRGKGLAIVSICLSGIFLFMIPVMLGVLLPLAAKAKRSGRSGDCVENVKAICLAARLYAEDNNGQFPSATNWCDAILPSLPNRETLHCPSASGRDCTYGLNRAVAGRTMWSVPPDLVMVFETAGGWNVSGGEGNLVPRSPHGSVFVIGFANGTVRQVSEEDLLTLRWEP